MFLPGEFHGLCSPRGRKESDTTERLSLSGLRPSTDRKDTSPQNHKTRNSRARTLQRIREKSETVKVKDLKSRQREQEEGDWPGSCLLTRNKRPRRSCPEDAASQGRAQQTSGRRAEQRFPDKAAGTDPRSSQGDLLMDILWEERKMIPEGIPEIGKGNGKCCVNVSKLSLCSSKMI